MIEACRIWVEEFVLKHNLCPFAHPFVRNGWVAYRLSSALDFEARVVEFLSILDELDEHPDPKTLLIIYDDPQLDFYSYLDLYEVCEEALNQENRVYQLASFHPDYCFEGESMNDPANLSNRSPYPMIHILRLTDVTHAIESHKDTDAIPARNIEYLRALFSRGPS